jgi:hypothetical protein
VNVEAVVNLLELLLGELAEQLPALEDLWITFLQLDDGVSGALLEVGISAVFVVESLLRVHVEHL